MNEIEKMPLVSVVMPAYNAGRFISESIHSALNQTIRDIELIVVDDKSSDNTCEIVEDIMKRDARVKLVRNDQNLGVARTRNRAFKLTRGKYIALLDSDDVWLPDKLEKQIQLAKRESAEIVYCSYSLIDEMGIKKCDDFIVPTATSVEQMLCKNVIGCSTVLLEGDLARKRGFPTDYYHEDYTYWLGFLCEGKKAVGVTDVMVLYRVYSGSKASNKIKCAQARWDVYRRFMKFSRWKSFYFLIRYAFAGAKKYRNV